MISIEEAVSQLLLNLDELGAPPFELEAIPEITKYVSELILIGLNEPNAIVGIMDELREQADLVKKIDKAVKLPPGVEMVDSIFIRMGLDAIAKFLQEQADKLKK